MNSILQRCPSLSLIILIITSSTILYSQDSTATHAFYFEAGGSGGAYSGNYEELLYRSQSVQLTYSLGLSCFPIDKNNGIVFVVPTLLHCNIGSGPHTCELGAGQALSVTTKGSGFSMLTPFVGYRYHDPLSRWSYRCTYTPIISYLFQWQYQHWMGISVGYQW